MNRYLPLACLVVLTCSPDAPQLSQDPGPPPSPSPALAVFIGEYAADADTVSLLERDGALWLSRWGGGEEALSETSDSTFLMGTSGGMLTLRLGEEGPSLHATEGTYVRLELGGAEGESFRITPVRPPDALRAEALAAQPPEEEGTFLESDLVELVSLDPSIRLDVRYAGTNNFMGEVFYTEPRAFLQRPAAEALVRAHQALAEEGYGLLIHDGYRPWYVTKMFWDATPEALKVFVADPALGSRHNRGCAVDLTLFDLATGDPIEMTGGYDEMSARSYPDYPGGTTLQRWHRDLLRRTMEAQDFTVYEAEWWHFDYNDWRSYRIGNEAFEDIGGPASGPQASGPEE